MARTYNESKCVFLAGPIEYWWDTDDHPNRFDSDAAVGYRRHRDTVRDFFVDRHYLVYSPHTAFKGDWNEKMQPVNDFVLRLCDIFVDMSPEGVPGNGTDHERELAKTLGKVILHLPPTDDSRWADEFNKNIVEMILETERIKHGW